MYNTSQCSRGILNKSNSEQKYDNFYYSSPKAATDMGVSSSESHDLTAFYEMLSASFGVLSQITGFYPSLDRIVETTLRPLNLGPGGGSYNKPISHLHHPAKKLDHKWLGPFVIEKVISPATIVGGITPCVLNGSIIMILYHRNYGRTWTSIIR